MRIWYERRRTIEEQALKSGANIEDQQFDSADGPCLAFDAITACKVLDLQRMARDRPNAPATEVADEIVVLCFDLAERGMVKSRVPPESLDVQTFVPARLAGFHATPAAARHHQDPAGHLKACVRIFQGLRNNDMLKDSTVGG